MAAAPPCTAFDLVLPSSRVPSPTPSPTPRPICARCGFSSGRARSQSSVVYSPRAATPSPVQRSPSRSGTKASSCSCRSSPSEPSTSPPRSATAPSASRHQNRRRSYSSDQSGRNVASRPTSQSRGSREAVPTRGPGLVRVRLSSKLARGGSLLTILLFPRAANGSNRSAMGLYKQVVSCSVGDNKNSAGGPKNLGRRDVRGRVRRGLSGVSACAYLCLHAAGINARSKHVLLDN